MDDDIKKRFLTNTDETGRFIVKSLKTDISYFVEPIGNKHSEGWIQQQRNTLEVMVINMLV